MTTWGKFIRKPELTGLRLDRVPSGDGDEITLGAAASPASGPVLLLLHGLEGGVRSHYVGGIWDAARQRGWQPRILLFRTCDGRMNRARRTYHSGETTDLDLVIRHLIDEDPTRAIGLAGISLGGNVMLKWLGEKGDAVPDQVRAAIAVSTPYDLARSSRAIDSGFARLYQWNFLRSLKRKAKLKVVEYPDICSLEALETLTTMWEFDDRFTAPLHGFRDAADYYEKSSSIRFLAGIRRPTLLLSARDDPFHSDKVLRDVEKLSAANPLLLVEFHRRGGHVGFVGGTPWRPTYYVETRVGSFLADHLETAATAG
jgi:predicted alpha/beta-fold hydrolase